MRRILRGDIGSELSAGLGDSFVASRSDLSQQGFELGEDCSIGLRSGEYFGKNTRRAPTSRIARRTAFPLWEPRFPHHESPLKGGREELFDIGAEAFAVDRPVEQAGASMRSLRSAARKVAVFHRP